MPELFGINIGEVLCCMSFYVVVICLVVRLGFAVEFILVLSEGRKDTKDGVGVSTAYHYAEIWIGIVDERT